MSDILINIKDSIAVGDFVGVEHTAQTPSKSSTAQRPLVCRENNAPSAPSKDFKEVRIERFALKSVVNKWLPDSETAKCLRWTLPKAETKIFTHKETGRAFYTGTRTCSSVWLCPCCSAKISERRRSELQDAFAVAETKGYVPVMLTLTAPHQVTDDLQKLIKSMTEAVQTVFKNRTGKDFLNWFQVAGRIRAFEVTYGDNGFHPHFHIILFVPKALVFSCKDMQDMIYPLWVNACRLRGLGVPSAKHGTVVNMAEKAFDYIAKFGLDDSGQNTVSQGWGLDSEMTKAHIKKSKKGYSMFDLLRQYLLTGDDKFRRIFMVYAEAFKGQRQLVWSKGLKQLLNVDEVTDKELAEEQDENATLFASLTFEEWRAVYCTNSEAYVLNCVELYPHRFDDLIRGLVVVYKAMPVKDFVTRKKCKPK